MVRYVRLDGGNVFSCKADSKAHIFLVIFGPIWSTFEPFCSILNYFHPFALSGSILAGFMSVCTILNIFIQILSILYLFEPIVPIFNQFKAMLQFQTIFNIFLKQFGMKLLVVMMFKIRLTKLFLMSLAPFSETFV